jgi:nitroreductase
MNKTAATSVPLHPLLSGRWSPRGFDRTHEVSPEQLTALLEAARWAASASNSQPWRFLVTVRGDAAFDRLVSTLAPGNQEWARHASALLLVAAETTTQDGGDQRWALYDTGQAVAQLVAQAHAEGLATHQMGGFDPAAVYDSFGLNGGLTPVVVIAVGVIDPAAPLPEPLAVRERAVRTRRPIEDLLLVAQWGAPDELQDRRTARL